MPDSVRFDSVEDAIADIKNGKIIVVVDDENRAITARRTRWSFRAMRSGCTRPCGQRALKASFARSPAATWACLS